eukprot:6658131-Alexandrium_andersonii.AAC.1
MLGFGSSAGDLHLPMADAPMRGQTWGRPEAGDMLMGESLGMLQLAHATHTAHRRALLVSRLWPRV